MLPPPNFYNLQKTTNETEYYIKVMSSSPSFFKPLTAIVRQRIYVLISFDTLPMDIASLTLPMDIILLSLNSTYIRYLLG